MTIPQTHLAALRQAERCLASGDAAGAIRLGEGLLGALPKHPALHVILAHAYRRDGRVEEALARFRSAAELAPADPARWAEFVTALLEAGQKGRARKVAQKAPLKGPAKKSLLDLAKSGPKAGPATGGVPPAALSEVQRLIQSGRTAEARDTAETLLQDHPGSAALTNLLGIIALTEGDAATAEAHFARTLEISPDFAGAAANLGLALIRQNRPDPAIAVLKRATELDPAAPGPQKNLALACLENRSFLAAAAHAETLLSIVSDEPDGLTILATASRELRRFDTALAAIDRLENVKGETEASLRLRFDTLADAGRIEEARTIAGAHRATSRTLRAEHARLTAQLGDVEAARAEMAAMIGEDPGDRDAWYRYGLYTDWRADDPLLPGLREAAERTKPDDHAADAVHYARAKAEFDLGNDDAGFTALETANALRGRGLTYDVDAEEARRANLEARWTKETLAALDGAGEPGIAPIFIVGAPRSGSTLVEHVIAAHPAVTSIGEDTFAGQFFPLDIASDRTSIRDAADAAARVFREVAGPEGRLLDKYLHNFWRLGPLAAAFPEARFVHTRRDPRAVAFSIFANRMDRGHAYANDLSHIAEFHLVLHRLMAHWDTILGDRLIPVDYEALVADPEPGIRALIRALGLPWDDACLRPEAVRKRVKTLSVAQVRSGIHNRSVARWQRVERHLRPFTDILEKAGVLTP